MKSKTFIVLGLFFLGMSSYVANAQNASESVFAKQINDPKAVYFTIENFKISGDGVGDDASALQSAIDQVRQQSTTGIVFIPEGTYRIGKTVYLWRGIRLIGYGKNRPVFKLGDNTPGYQEGEHRYMVHFAHGPGFEQGSIQPGTWRTEEFIDGTWTTFYSGINNINFEIGDGNPAAIAVRFHVAQVCALENIDFNIGNGRGGVQDMGNLIEKCTFRGGEFGIKTVASPPDWPVTVLDCTFEGQREASIIADGARMLVIRGRFRNASTGILVPDIERLFVEDTWFEDISNSALVINNFVPPQLQINLVKVKLSNVPYSVRLSGRAQGWSRDEIKWDYEAPAPIYLIESFSHGLHIESSNGQTGYSIEFATKIEQSPIEELGEFTSIDIPDLPPQETWVSILDLGAKGDGTTDDSDIFEKAIANHANIYIPMGNYVISRTLTFLPQTKFIGFHPSRTRIILRNGTIGFNTTAIPSPLLITPENGSNIITGIGFNLGMNPGAIGLKWMAGANSYFNDGHFGGGGGRRGEGNTHSFLITDGGGGIFKNIWIVDSSTKLAFLVSNTITQGKIYQVSIEHHKNLEVKLDKVENWSFYGLQLEEDRGSENALGIKIKDSKNIFLANFHSHRTTGNWKPYHSCIQIRNSGGITILGNEMRGAVFPYENAVFDEITGLTIPYNFFTKLIIE
jgi:hypothetical protein